jgi:hypothetical protein
VVKGEINMTRYYGGCNRCGTHDGEFESSLPGGCCVDHKLAGLYFCDACEALLKADEAEKDKIIAAFKRIPKAALKFGYASATFSREEMDQLARGAGA